MKIYFAALRGRDPSFFLLSQKKEIFPSVQPLSSLGLCGEFFFTQKKAKSICECAGILRPLQKCGR